MIKRLRVRMAVAGAYSSPEFTLCTDPYSVSVPPPCYRMTRKRLRSFRQECRWQVAPKHAYTLDPTKSEWAVQIQCGNLTRNEFTRNSSLNTRLQSFQLAEPPWTDPGPKSGISVHELLSTKEKGGKKREKKRAGVE